MNSKKISTKIGNFSSLLQNSKMKSSSTQKISPKKVVLTGDDIIDKLQKECKLTTREATEIFEAVFAELKESIMHEKHIKLSGVGDFILSDDATGKRVVFKTGLKLQQRMLAYVLANEQGEVWQEETTYT